jgi:hypothetical protein
MDKCSTDPGQLLIWLGQNYIPLMLYRENHEDEEIGSWVVVDASTSSVWGSGETPFEALSIAYLEHGND